MIHVDIYIYADTSLVIVLANTRCGQCLGEDCMPCESFDYIQYGPLHSNLTRCGLKSACMNEYFANIFRSKHKLIASVVKKYTELHALHSSQHFSCSTLKLTFFSRNALFAHHIWLSSAFAVAWIYGQCGRFRAVLWRDGHVQLECESVAVRFVLGHFIWTTD